MKKEKTKTRLCSAVEAQNKQTTFVSASEQQEGHMTWMENKVVFTSICVPERVCFILPLFQTSWAILSFCLFIDEQTPECERNVISKQRQWPQMRLKWDSGPETPFHKDQQRSVDSNVCAFVCIVFLSGSPLPVVYLAAVCTQRLSTLQKQPVSLGFLYCELMHFAVCEHYKCKSFRNHKPV